MRIFCAFLVLLRTVRTWARNADISASTTILASTSLNCTTVYDSLSVKTVPRTTVKTTISSSTTLYPSRSTVTLTSSLQGITTSTTTTALFTNTTIASIVTTTVTSTGTSFYSTCSPASFSRTVSKRAAVTAGTTSYPTAVTCVRTFTLITEVFATNTANATVFITVQPTTTAAVIMSNRTTLSAMSTTTSTVSQISTAYPTDCTPPSTAACTDEYTNYGCEYDGGYSPCGCWQDVSVRQASCAESTLSDVCDTDVIQSYGTPTCFNLTGISVSAKSCVNNIDCGHGMGCMYGYYASPYCAPYDHCFDMGYTYPAY